MPVVSVGPGPHASVLHNILLQRRVFDIGLTLTLVGFLLNLQGLILVNLRLLGIPLIAWARCAKVAHEFNAAIKVLLSLDR